MLYRHEIKVETILINLSLLHSETNCGRSYSAIIISNLLPYYLANVHCSHYFTKQSSLEIEVKIW